MEKQDGAYLYVAKFNRDYSSFVAGGAGRDELRGFDWATGDLQWRVSNLPRSILSLDFANNSSDLAIGLMDSSVRIFSMDDND